MLGIVLNLPPALESYFVQTPPLVVATHALVYIGWIPIFGVLIWGLTQVWVDYKQGQYFAHLHWSLLQVSIPQGAINTPKGMELFFNNLQGAKSALTWKETRLMGKFQAYFSLEIVGDEGQVRFFIRCLDKHRDLVEAALYAQYPEAQIMEVEDYVDAIPTYYPNDTHKVFGAEMALSKPQYYPIRTYEQFEHQGEKDFRFKDPLLNIIEVMGKMGKDEHLWLQIIIMPPDEQDWAKEGEKYLNKLMGKEEKHKKSMVQELIGAAGAFPAELVAQATGVQLGGGHDEHGKEDDFRMFKMTPQEREVADAIAEKISKMGWLTKIRVVYTAPVSNYRKPLMASAIKGIFHPYGHLAMNKLGLHNKSVPKDDYFWMEWQMATKMTKLAKRYKARLLGAGAAPFILNSEEVATLFHFPAGDARTPVLMNAGARRAEAPSILPFADEGTPDLPDWKELVKDKLPHGSHEEPAPLAVPTPHLPADAESDFPPQPGRPAPLPPGLDVRPRALNDDDDAPSNLPVM